MAGPQLRGMLVSTLTEQLKKRLFGESQIDRRELYHQLLTLARAVDQALAAHQRPTTMQTVFQVFAKIAKFKDDLQMRPAIMVLMLSVKSACRSGWFEDYEADELLASYLIVLDNLMISGECWKPRDQLLFHDGATHGTNDVDYSNFLLTICSRFFPRLRVNSVILGLSVKQGYEVRGCDFQVTSQLEGNTKLQLFVCQEENIDTSACLVHPALTNFLLNGKGVDRRTSVSLDSGPQSPTDVVSMLRIGCNFLQVVGEFSARYIVAIATMNRIQWSAASSQLQNYVAPSIIPSADDELIEGPSRVSLRCPISHMRISTPVKGVSCKHHQCFDYDSFLEINERRPAWRCPCCNTHVNCTDLRLDPHMEKVLKEVGEAIYDVMVAENGAWELVHSKNDLDEACPGSLSRTGSVGVDKVMVLDADEDLEVPVVVIDDDDDDDDDDGNTPAGSVDTSVDVVESPVGLAFRHSDFLDTGFEVEDYKPAVRSMLTNEQELRERIVSPVHNLVTRRIHIPIPVLTAATSLTTVRGIGTITGTITRRPTTGRSSGTMNTRRDLVSAVPLGSATRGIGMGNDIIEPIRLPNTGMTSNTPEAPGGMPVGFHSVSSIRSSHNVSAHTSSTDQPTMMIRQPLAERHQMGLERQQTGQPNRAAVVQALPAPSHYTDPSIRARLSTPAHVSSSLSYATMGLTNLASLMGSRTSAGQNSVVGDAHQQHALQLIQNEIQQIIDNPSASNAQDCSNSTHDQRQPLGQVFNWEANLRPGSRNAYPASQATQDFQSPTQNNQQVHNSASTSSQEILTDWNEHWHARRLSEPPHSIRNTHVPLGFGNLSTHVSATATSATMGIQQGVGARTGPQPGVRNPSLVSPGGVAAGASAGGMWRVPPESSNWRPAARMRGSIGGPTFNAGMRAGILGTASSSQNSSSNCAGQFGVSSNGITLSSPRSSTNGQAQWRSSGTPVGEGQLSTSGNTSGAVDLCSTNSGWSTLESTGSRLEETWIDECLLPAPSCQSQPMDVIFS